MSNDEKKPAAANAAESEALVLKYKAEAADGHADY